MGAERAQSPTSPPLVILIHKGSGLIDTMNWISFRFVMNVCVSRLTSACESVRQLGELPGNKTDIPCQMTPHTPPIPNKSESNESTAKRTSIVSVDPSQELELEAQQAFKDSSLRKMRRAYNTKYGHCTQKGIICSVRVGGVGEP